MAKLGKDGWVCAYCKTVYATQGEAEKCFHGHYRKKTLWKPISDECFAYDQVIIQTKRGTVYAVWTVDIRKTQEGKYYELNLDYCGESEIDQILYWQKMPESYKGDSEVE